MKPRRSWLLWPTMLLPKATPLHVVWKVGVDGPLESGQVRHLPCLWDGSSGVLVGLCRPQLLLVVSCCWAD